MLQFVLERWDRQRQHRQGAIAHANRTHQICRKLQNMPIQVWLLHAIAFVCHNFETDGVARG